MPRLVAVVSVCAVSLTLLGTAALEAQSPLMSQLTDTIRVDSLMREAPVSTLGELLNARVPGLMVSQREASAGGAVQLRIRGPNSVYAGGEPLVLVDGARYMGTAWPEPFPGGAAGAGATSPLDDLDPNDVETIQVLTGPAAAALYGTGAANGVLLITTKQGRPGRPRGNVHARRRTADVPSAAPLTDYWGWTSVDGTVQSYNCTLARVAAGNCTQDSISVSPSSAGGSGMIRGLDGWTYGGNVAGGTEAVRYYFGANVDDATGFADLSPPGGEGHAAEQGLTRVNLRANMTARLGERAEVRVHSAYLRGSSAGFDRVLTLRRESDERTRRFLGSVTGQVRPASWLLARATVGYDHGRRTRTTLTPPHTTASPYSPGSAGLDSALQRATRVDVAAIATTRLGRLATRTTVGAEFTTRKTQVLGMLGTGLPPNGTSPNQATTRQMSQSFSEITARGIYFEEALALNERLIMTGGLRSERLKMPHEYAAELYPRASVSWLASAEPWMPRLPGVDRLRLRYAFGVSGQHSPFAAYPASPLVGPFPGADDPERVSEHEVGVDFDAMGNRVRLGLTRYSRRTTDQLVPAVPRPGMGPILVNAGRASQHGLEMRLTARVLETRPVSWDVSVQHASYKTELDDLGEAMPFYSPTGGYAESYPLGGRFLRPIVGYADANGDGIIVPSEVQRSETFVYAGESTPPRSQVLATTLGLLDRRLRLAALLERRSGHTQIDAVRTSQCAAARCRGAVDPSASLGEQAEAVGGHIFMARGDFTRLREVSAAFELPAGIARALRGRAVTLTLAGRNLALWNDLKGVEPETGDGVPQGKAWMLRLDVDL